MRRFWPPSIVRLLFLLLPLLSPALGAQTQIAGSVHDFSDQPWSGGEICIACHVPHQAASTETGRPLWNHEITTATYTLYSSGSLTETPVQPGAASTACLSCHDGTVAVDALQGLSGTSMMSGSGLLGTDLSNDHPVGIRWSHKSPLPPCSNCHDTHNPSYRGPLPFFSGYVECATCHDPHGRDGNPTFLRKPASGSQICLHCHGM